VAILITGGAGYIGRWVARDLLAMGIEPVAFDRLAETGPYFALLDRYGIGIEEEDVVAAARRSIALKRER
jgi:nucleoside-diphosphate-sugar epimerase